MVVLHKSGESSAFYSIVVVLQPCIDDDLSHGAERSLHRRARNGVVLLPTGTVLTRT